MQEKQAGFKKLFEVLKLENKEISAIYFYAILSGLIQLSLPLGIQAILGFVLGATMVTSVYLLIFIIILSVLIMGYMQINQMKIIEKIQQKIFVKYAFAFSETIPNFDLKYVDKYYLPEKINRFFDTINIQKAISKILIEIPLSSIQILLGLILLCLYHPFFIIFSVTLLLVIFLLFYFTGKKGLATSIEESDYKYKVVAWLQEIGRVIKSFKYSQGTNINLIKTDENLLNYLNARTSHFHVLLFQYKSLVFFKVFITALILILGSYLLFEQKINIGQFVAVEIIIITITNSLEKLIVSLEHIYDIVTGFYKLDSVLENKLEEDGTIELELNQIKIELKEVGFSYLENQKIFNSISFSVEPNSITCISGEENSGKSTLLKLISGEYKTFTGSITINNIPLKNYTLKSLRNNTGIFLYEQDLFQGTLYENITLGRNNINIKEIMSLIQKIGFDDFIAFFPDSFDTKILPLGKTLPLSIRKKIILLRAFIHDPNLLLLESPWTGLDEESRENIQNHLLELSKTKTIIITSNNINFAKKCTQNIYLKDGLATSKN